MDTHHSAVGSTRIKAHSRHKLNGFFFTVNKLISVNSSQGPSGDRPSTQLGSTWELLGSICPNFIGKEVLCTHLFQLVDTGIPTPQNSLIESIQVHPFDGYNRANVPNL